jgi:phosphoserine phosphatase
MFSALTQLLADCLCRLSPGIADLVGTLQQKGIAVFLVSGGFRQMIEVIAHLNLVVT